MAEFLSSFTYLRGEPVVVAQLVEQSLPTPEVRSSNPVIGRNLYWLFIVNCIEIKEKEAGIGPNYKKRTGIAQFQHPHIFTEIAENVIRTCHRTLVPPPLFEDKLPEEEEEDQRTDEDEAGGGGGDRPDFSAWKVAIKNLNK